MEQIKQEVTSIKQGKFYISEQLQRLDTIIEQLSNFNPIEDRLVHHDKVMKLLQEQMRSCVTIHLVNATLEGFKDQIEDAVDTLVQEHSLKTAAAINEAQDSIALQTAQANKVDWEPFVALQKDYTEFKNFMERNLTSMCEGYNENLLGRFEEKADKKYVKQMLERRMETQFDDMKKRLTKLEDGLGEFLEDDEDSSDEDRLQNTIQDELTGLEISDSIHAGSDKPKKSMKGKISKHVERRAETNAKLRQLQFQVDKVKGQTLTNTDNLDILKQSSEIQKLKIEDIELSIRQTDTNATDLLKASEDLVKRLKASEKTQKTIDKQLKALHKTVDDKMKDELWNHTTRIVKLETNLGEVSRKFFHNKEKSKQKINDVIKFVQKKKDGRKEIKSLKARIDDNEDMQKELVKYLESNMEEIKGPVRDTIIRYQEEVMTLQEETARQRDANRISAESLLTTRTQTEGTTSYLSRIYECDGVSRVPSKPITPSKTHRALSTPRRLISPRTLNTSNEGQTSLLRFEKQMKRARTDLRQTTRSWKHLVNY